MVLEKSWWMGEMYYLRLSKNRFRRISSKRIIFWMFHVLKSNFRPNQLYRSCFRVVLLVGISFRGYLCRLSSLNVTFGTVCGTLKHLQGLEHVTSRCTSRDTDHGVWLTLVWKPITVTFHNEAMMKSVWSGIRFERGGGGKPRKFWKW